MTLYCRVIVTCLLLVRAFSVSHLSFVSFIFISNTLLSRMLVLTAHESFVVSLTETLFRVF